MLPKLRKHLEFVGSSYDDLVAFPAVMRPTQAEAASQLGVTQPRISDLVRGKIGRFSLDRLVKMVSAAGLYIDVQVDEAA